MQGHRSVCVCVYAHTLLPEWSGTRIWVHRHRVPRPPFPGEALPQQLSLGISGRASQQQLLLPVHEFVGEAVAAPTQLLSHVGSLQRGRGSPGCE